MSTAPARLSRRLLLARTLGWLAACFVVLSLGLYLAHRAEVRFMAMTARRVAGEHPRTPEETLVHFTEFAHREIRKPTWNELPSGLVRFYYWANPTHPGPGDVVRWGADYRGGCGSHTRVVVAMLQASGIPCRPLLLLDDEDKSIHTVIQARIDGRWVVSDALFGVVFRRADGQLATVEDLAADSANYWRQVPPNAGYKSIYDYDNVTLFNWRKIPVVLPAAKWLLTRVIGPERVARFVRPSIWMWPRAMGLAACLVVAVAFSAAALWVGRRA